MRLLRQRIEAGIDATFEPHTFSGGCQRVPSVAEREVGSLLIGVGSVIDNVAGEIVFPCGDDVEQQFALNIDECGEMVTCDRNSASR